MSRLSWAKKPRPTGLMSIGSGSVRPYELKKDGVVYAMVVPKDKWNFDGGWYWHTMAAEPRVNTSGQYKTFDECKSEATAHVKKYLQVKT